MRFSEPLYWWCNHHGSIKITWRIVGLELFTIVQLRLPDCNVYPLCLTLNSCMQNFHPKHRIPVGGVVVAS